MLFAKKTTNSEEYERLSKRLSDVEAGFLTLKARLEGIEMENKNLRDRILRRIQVDKDNPFNDKAPTTPQGLNTFSPFGR